MTQQAGLPCPIRLFGIQTFLESGQRWAWLKPGAGEANRKSAPSSCAEVFARPFGEWKCWLYPSVTHAADGINFRVPAKG
jgi:hypothetical protein